MLYKNTKKTHKFPKCGNLWSFPSYIKKTGKIIHQEVGVKTKSLNTKEPYIPINGCKALNIPYYSSNAVNEMLSYSAITGRLLSSKAFSQPSTPVPHHAFIMILLSVTGIFSVAV